MNIIHFSRPLWPLLLMGTAFLSAQGVRLDGLDTPGDLEVVGQQVYVVQDAVIRVFSCEDGKLLRRFCRKGSGPGEFEPNPAMDMPLSIGRMGSNLFVSTPMKCCLFSSSGTLIHDRPLGFFASRLEPWSRLLVALRYHEGHGAHSYQLVALDENLETVFNAGTNDISYEPGTISTLGPFYGFTICNDLLILVSEQPQGVHLEGYDHHGNRVVTETVPCNPVPMTERDRKEVGDWTASKSWYKRIPPEYRKKLAFPRHLPMARRLDADGGRLFILTFEERDTAMHFLVCHPGRGEVQQMRLPFPPPGLLGHIPFRIRDGKVYILQEEEGSGDWFLQTLPLPLK